MSEKKHKKANAHRDDNPTRKVSYDKHKKSVHLYGLRHRYENSPAGI